MSRFRSTRICSNSRANFGSGLAPAAIVDYLGMTMDKTRSAKFKIGQVVRHRVFPFRGVIFDIDPEFNNTEEWYQSIPVEVRPAEGSAVLSPVRRKRGERIHRLRLRAEPVARHDG